MWKLKYQAGLVGCLCMALLYEVLPKGIGFSCATRLEGLGCLSKTTTSAIGHEVRLPFRNYLRQAQVERGFERTGSIPVESVFIDINSLVKLHSYVGYGF